MTRACTTNYYQHIYYIYHIKASAKTDRIWFLRICDGSRSASPYPVRPIFLADVDSPSNMRKGGSSRKGGALKGFRDAKEKLIESKGIRLAIKALSYLENNKVTFDVYGQGPMKEELEQLVADCQLESIVRFKGFVTHDEVLKAFYSCDALLFPSLKEAWGLAVSEAMASGLPVICVDRGGPSYMVNEECGLKNRPATPIQF